MCETDAVVFLPFLLLLWILRRLIQYVPFKKNTPFIHSLGWEIFTKDKSTEISFHTRNFIYDTALVFLVYAFEKKKKKKGESTALGILWMLSDIQLHAVSVL